MVLDSQDVGIVLDSDATQNNINVFSLTVEQTVSRIQQCAAAGSGFDIYQVTAFLYCNRECGNYPIAAIKSMSCLMIQGPILAYLIDEIVAKGFEKRVEMCDSSKEYSSWWLAYFGFACSVYIALSLNQMYQKTIHGGMNCVCMMKFTNLPDCLSGRWLFLGCFYNAFLFKVAIILSLFVIFFSTTVMDMVLNSVALLFVVQMDDVMVTAADYKMIETFLDGYAHRRKNMIGLPYSNWWFSFACVVQVVDIIITLLTYLAMFTAPALIFICL